MIDTRPNPQGMSAATWETAFDSTNRMVVGYNAYKGPRFVGVYDDPLGREKLPNSYLYDLMSMPYTATFDEKDNLYVGDITRGRVLIYHSPFGNPSPESTPTPPDSIPPTPHYSVTIESVSPGPQYCVLRRSSRLDERRLEFRLSVMPEDWSDLGLQFRRPTRIYRQTLDFEYNPIVRAEGNSIVVVVGWLAPRFWGDRDRLHLIAGLVTSENTSLSNWSPPFLLADDV